MGFYRGCEDIDNIDDEEMRGYFEKYNKLNKDAKPSNMPDQKDLEQPGYN